MSIQLPANASLEQIVRALAGLALHVEADTVAVANEMSTQAFEPAPMLDANGNAFSISMVDVEQGVTADPTEWIETSFARVYRTDGLKVTPPYPNLQLLSAPGEVLMTIDQNGAELRSYTVDAVVAAYSDRPQQATQRALALITAFNRLVKRNPQLGGLVSLIKGDGTPVASGEAQQQPGLVAGYMQRFAVLAWESASS